MSGGLSLMTCRPSLASAIFGKSSTAAERDVALASRFRNRATPTLSVNDAASVSESIRLYQTSIALISAYSAMCSR